MSPARGGAGVWAVSALIASLPGCSPGPAPLAIAPLAVTPLASVPAPAVYRTVSGATLMGSGAVHAGRGAVFGAHRYELVEGPAGRWSLAVGSLGEEPRLLRDPELDGCVNPALAALPGQLVFACEPHADGGELRIFSRDPRGGFRAMRGARGVALQWPRLWPATSDGAFILEGACPREEDAGLAYPVIRRVDGSEVVVKPPWAAGTRLFAVFPTYRGDLYMLGDDSAGLTFLLASSDQGATIQRYELPAVLGADQGYEPRLLGHTGALYAEDGGWVTVMVQEADTSRWLRYTSPSYGRNLVGEPLPFHLRALDLAGARGFAYWEEGEGHAWETNDAGATWEAVAVPPAVDTAEIDYNRMVACGDGGCLIGRREVRVGWELPLAKARH